MKTFTIRTRAALAVAGLAALALTGCASGPSDAGSNTSSSAGAGTPDIAQVHELTVFAAASLTDTFTELAADFEAANPGVTVNLNFDGSSGLATQLVEGAPADVFAAANTTTMDTVVEAGLASGPTTFVTNVLEIAVPAGNPAGVETFADLAGDDVTLVVCAVEVPCGAATQKIEEATGITLNPVSEENAVTDVLGKVVSGDADAGLVYATDILSAGADVEGISFAEADEAINNYPIAPLTESANPELANLFVQYILGEHGQEVLAAAGFGQPE